MKKVEEENKDWKENPNVEGSPAFNSANETERLKDERQEGETHQDVLDPRQDERFKQVPGTYDEKGNPDPEGKYTRLSRELSPEEIEALPQEQKEVIEETRTIKLSDKEAIDAYINDPQIKDDHLKIAQQLETIFGTKWFTVEMIVNKTLMKDKKHVMGMMLGLQLFNMVTATEGGINYKHQTKFKLTISIEDKMKVLQQHRQNHLKQIELIDKELEVLSNEARDSKNNEK